MKRIFFATLFITLSILSANAQYVNGGYEELLKLKNTHTYVVLTDSNEVFNNNIKKAVEENWKISKYSFIKYSEFKKYKNNEKNSFIIVVELVRGEFQTSQNESTSVYKLSDTKFYENKSKYYFSINPIFFTVLFGGEKRFNPFKDTFIYYSSHSNDLNSEKLISYIQLINYTISIIEDKKMNKFTMNNMKNYYNSTESIVDKTIVFREFEIPKHSIRGKKDEKYIKKEGIAEDYKGKFIIASDKELKTIMDLKSKDYLFYGSFIFDNITAIYLYDINGKIHYFEKLNANAHPGTTYGFKTILEDLQDARK